MFIKKSLDFHLAIFLFNNNALSQLLIESSEKNPGGCPHVSTTVDTNIGLPFKNL